jgi:hypothetical protein
MQTVSLTGRPKSKTAQPDGDTKLSLRLRALRLLSDRYAYAERPSVAAEFILFGIFVLTACWPLLNLVRALSLIR